LACKQSIVADAFDKAEEKLLSLSGDGYIDFLAGQAARAAHSGKEEIVLNGKDKKLYGSKVLQKANSLLVGMGKAGKLTLSEEEGTFAGGLMLRQGSVSVNCTVEALMAEARQSMASSVAAELFS
jgi:V/A-type H+-transporting ATPase subunit E